jgi:dienelactone hydrolase
MRVRALAALTVLALTAGCAAPVRDVKFSSGADADRTTLAGAIYRPGAREPAPAVVLLHTCAGLRPHVSAWARWLAREGYVALVVDSFGPRGADDVCRTLGNPTVHEVAWDAIGALAYLRTQPFVDADRIAVMGWSYGAMAALDASRANFIRMAGGRGFRAAVPFYPHCSYLSSDIAIPVLLLLGGSDDWAPAGACVERATALAQAGRAIQWHVYHGAAHGFDQAELGDRTVIVLGHRLQYDAAATGDAERRVRAFLAEHLRPDAR